jgi:hypothetical protein
MDSDDIKRKHSYRWNKRIIILKMQLNILVQMCIRINEWPRNNLTIIIIIIIIFIYLNCKWVSTRWQ